MNNHTDDHETTATNPGSFLAGALFGGLVGAGAMLLLAPQSGKQTREQIQLKGMELREQATEAVDDAVAQTRSKVRKITTDVSDKAKEIQQSGQEMVDEQKTRLSTAVAAGKTAMRSLQSDHAVHPSPAV